MILKMLMTVTVLSVAISSVQEGTVWCQSQMGAVVQPSGAAQQPPLAHSITTTAQPNTGAQSATASQSGEAGALLADIANHCAMASGSKVVVDESLAMRRYQEGFGQSEVFPTARLLLTF